MWGVFKAEGWRVTAAPCWFGVPAKSCELRTGNPVGGGVGGKPGKGKVEGNPPQALGLDSAVEVWPHLQSSSPPHTPSISLSTCPPLVVCLPMFLNSGFHHPNLSLLLSQILPSCQHAGALPGNLPGPQSHSQTPAASKPGKYPIAVLSPVLPPFPSTQGSALSPSPASGHGHLYLCPLRLTISNP